MMFVPQLLICLSLSTLLSSNRGVDASFAETSGVLFVIDGRPFYPNGFNAYWLMIMASDPAGKGKVSSALQQASVLGLNLVRSWAFSDGGHRPLQHSPGLYNEDMFKGLDFVIAEANKYGIYLILSLVNNFDDYGGKRQYVDWARDQGGQHHLNSDDDFYTNNVVKGYYKSHVERVLTRINTITGEMYKNDPTIFAWELMNEPRCVSDLSSTTLQDWITEMASYVKSIDSNHLLEVGMEGFYGESTPQRKQFNPGYGVGTDFFSNNRLPDIDFATIHAYPDQWLPAGSGNKKELSFLRRWIRSHMNDSKKVLRKPLVIAEFGKSSKLRSDYTVGQRDALYTMVYDSIYASSRAGGPCVGGLFWQMLLETETSELSDGYEIILPGTSSTTQIISEHSQRILGLTNYSYRFSSRGSEAIMRRF